ncbi:MAG: efflux RND transporter periplasmic adaptor subunit [Planctomycetota bacterium]|nr:efflux RND transporter periplasmic adaptor subunit [Planctomycetota bacterium]
MNHLINFKLFTSGLKISILKTSILLIVLSGCSGSFEMGGTPSESDRTDSTDRKVPVETAACWIDSVQLTLSISTDLETLDRVDLTARVSGVVTEVPLDEGARVGQGELVLRLDPTDLDLAVREKKILLAETKNRLGSAGLALKEVASGAALARVALDRASAERQRLENLFEGDVGRLASEETLEVSRFAELSARISLEQSEHSLEKMDLTLAIEKQGVEKANLALEKARLDRSRSEIVSPFDGRVQMIDLRPGEHVSAGSKVATVMRSQPLLAWVRVPQSRLSELRLGLEAIVTTETARGRTFKGKVTAISPAVNSAEGTIRVRVEVDDPDQLLLPGAFATCTLILGVHENALLVPKNSRLFEGNRSIVFIVRENKAVRVEMVPGLQSENQLEVLSSVPQISLEDRVVVRGQARLRDGDPVEDVSLEEETIVEEKKVTDEVGGRG